jgi:hypothetical protein
VGFGGCGKGMGSGIDKQVIWVMDGGAGMDGGSSCKMKAVLNSPSREGDVM